MTASYAQAQINFGARAGFSLTNFSQSYDGKKPDKEDRSKMKPGFQIGVTGEYALSDVFAVQSGLLIATQGAVFKGTDVDEDFGKTEWKAKASLTYLHVPFNALYLMDLGGTKLALHAGPCVGIALAGKAKSEETWGGKTETSEVKYEFGSGLLQMRRLDLSLGLGAALQFSSIRAGLSYNIGLANLSNADKYVQRNNGLTLSLTYLFGM